MSAHLQAVGEAIGPCSRCYPRLVSGTVATIYGPYCQPCYERHREVIEAKTQELRASRRAYFRSLSEMGERFGDRTFENYRLTDANRAAYEAALDAWESRGGLYLHGKPGNGKTHLAAAIANASIAAEIETIFVTGVGLLQRIREAYKRNQSETERGILGHYADAPILVLDDLGTEPFTADTGRLFYSLINRRYEHRKLRLVITSNLSLSELILQWRASGVEAHVGDKIADRIAELCDNRIVRIDAPSERTRKAS